MEKSIHNLNHKFVKYIKVQIIFFVSVTIIGMWFFYYVGTLKCHGYLNLNICMMFYFVSKLLYFSLILLIIHQKISEKIILFLFDIMSDFKLRNKIALKSNLKNILTLKFLYCTTKTIQRHKNFYNYFVSLHN